MPNIHEIKFASQVAIEASSEIQDTPCLTLLYRNSAIAKAVSCFYNNNSIFCNKAIVFANGLSMLRFNQNKYDSPAVMGLEI